MDLATIEPAIKALISRLSGLEALWEDQPRDYVDPSTQAVCLLSWTSSRGIGFDERILIDATTPVPGGEKRGVYFGNREMTLTVKVESYDQTSGMTARTYLEKVRNGLSFQATGVDLASVNIVLVNAGSVVNFPETRDDRRVSISALDLTLANRTRTLDPDPQTWIEFVRLTQHLLP